MSWKNLIASVLVFSLSITTSIATIAAQVYRPSGLDTKNPRALVVIHGCLQSAESMALGTGFNRLAEQDRFLVIYPQVPAGQAYGCWSWFESKNQIPQSGELQFIRDEVELALKQNGLRHAKLFVTGISSGGATTAGLLACYPKIFKAAAIHSAPSYGLAQNQDEGEQVLKDGPPEQSPTTTPCRPADYRGALMVIQGENDKVVNPKHADKLIQDFVSQAPALRSESLKENGMSFTKSVYQSRDGRSGVKIMVQALGHTWPGLQENQRFNLPTQIPFFQSRGFNSTNAIHEFFKTQSL